MLFARAVLMFLLLSAVSPAWAQVDGRARVISAAEAQSMVAHYRSIPGNGVIRGEGRVVREGEARSIVKKYRSIPGNGVVRGEGRAVTADQARSIVKKYRSIPGNGVVRGEGRAVTEGEARSIVKKYRSIPGNGVVRGEGRVVTEGEARSIVNGYKSIPGGLVLEGHAAGMQWVKKVRYDSASNSFVLNDDIAFASPISASSAAVLIRSIMQDDKIGVSLTEDMQIAYGKLPDASNVAADLRLADGLLGDLVLPPRDWTIGYRLANGFTPREDDEPTDASVFFRFKDYELAVKDRKLVLERASFEAIVVPIIDSKAADGGFLPDFEAIAHPAGMAAYEANAKHVASNISYYLTESIVARAFAYGQVTAFVRSLKSAGVDLGALVRSLERNGRPAQSTRPAAGDLEDDWQAYLKEIQIKNAYANWSGPPYDLYRQRKELASIKESN